MDYKNILGNFPAKSIIQSWLKAGYVYNNIFHESRVGTPQGGVISPLLANIALHGMEEALNVKYRKNGNSGYTAYYSKYVVVRYADDFVVLCRTKEDAEKVPQLLEQYLIERGLTLAPDKTFVTNLHDGFDFLGFNIRAYKTETGDKVLTKPSNKSLKEFRTKIKKIFTSNRNDINMLIKKGKLANKWNS